MILVVDASAVGAMLFEEPEGPTIRAHIRGETVLAPELIDYELANVCWKKIRRDPASRAEILALLASLAFVPVSRVRVPPTAVAALAVDTGITAYDASYLWLAMAHEAELVTLDTRLAQVTTALREAAE